MITDLHSGQTIVRRLRIKSADVDPNLARQRIANLLNDANLQAAQGAPAAIILIRRLRISLPLTLRVDHGRCEELPGWDETVKAELCSLVRNAARPWLTAVPAAADAVVFLDRAELLACLAADWCQGIVSTRWWWRILLKGENAAQFVSRLWRDETAYLPAALQQLASTKRAIAFLATLDDATSRELVQRLVHSFALHALAPVIEGFFKAEGAAPFVPTTAANLQLVASALREPQGPAPPVPPWSVWVPETEAPELHLTQQLLLGLALMIQVEPSRVRTRSFADAVGLWQHALSVWAIDQNRPALDQKRVSPERAAVDGSPTDHARWANSPLQPPHRQVGSISGEQIVAADSSSQAGETQTNEAIVANSAPTLSESQLMALSGSESRELPPTTPETHTFDLPLPPEESDSLQLPSKNSEAAFTNPPRSAEAKVETEFGGLFYLLNLALYLGLYGDFASPANLGIELNIWDFVALVGRQLIGEQLERDPVWQLLATLAGREEESPGHAFEPGDEWRIPSAWLEAFPEAGRCEWTTAGGRLQVIHPWQFLVLDLPAQSATASELAPVGTKQLERELKVYEHLRLAISSVPLREGLVLGSGEPALTADKQQLRPAAGVLLRAWLDRLTPYIRARLRQALGAAAAKDLCPIFAGRATVVVTATHVGVFQGLADLPLEIRIAGLDRDPGWVPAAGRFIAFHFV